VSALAPGVKVRITCGASVGVEGVIFGQWPRFWEQGVPLWVVLRRDLVGRSIVRADYLEVIP
jgi:hypothetical protein